MRKPKYPGQLIEKMKKVKGGSKKVAKKVMKMARKTMKGKKK